MIENYRYPYIIFPNVFFHSGPWRWYHENMLDCCIPIKTVEEEGINFDNFICLANCNALHTDTVRVSDGASIDEFRDAVKKYVMMDDSFVILSYSRKILEQTGKNVARKKM